MRLKGFICFLPLLLLLGLATQQTVAQTLYDWQTTAPDGNWKQGIASGPRWNPGGLWDEPPSSSATRLRFNNNTFPTMTNNSSSSPYIIGQLFFGSSATTARTLSGGSLQFFEFGATWPRIENQSTTLHTFNIPFAASTNSGFNMELVASSGNLDFGSSATINNNGRTIQIYGNNSAIDGTNRAIRLTGIVSGSGILNVSQFGVVKLNGAHTYTGQTQVDNGELWIESSGSISASSGIFIGNGGQLANVTKLWLSNASGGTTFSNNFTINNGNASTREVGGLNTSGTHTFSGNITNNSTTGGAQFSTINAGGSVTFSGVLSGAGAFNFQGPGTITLSGASANTYTGASNANGGTLILNKSANTIAIPTALTVATGVTVRTDAANQFGTGTVPAITLNGTGTLNLNSNNQKIDIQSASSTSSLSLGSGIANIDISANRTFAGVISGTGGVTKTGTAVETLTHPTNTYSGTTTISAGEIRLNPTGNATFASPVVLNGGTLGTSGITATRTWTSSSTLGLTANSTIALQSATAHTLTFAASNAVSWTGGFLFVTGWSGSFNGTTGTGGKIFVGSSATGLTTDQLVKILFLNGSNYHTATILSTGEVVPTALVAMFWNGNSVASWTGANAWSLNPTGPYNQTWVSGRAAYFNLATNNITGASTNVGAIVAFESVTGTASGTIATGGTVAPIFVDNGKVANFGSQAISTAAGTGFIKNGSGTLQWNAAAYPGGFTLNSGMIAGGVNAMGGAAGNSLTINGGTIGLPATRDYSGKFPAGITLNADFTLGSTSSPSVGTSNATFNNNTALGTSVTRTITLGGTGLYTWNGIISGTGSNLTLAATAAGTLFLGGANTYGGNTTINGGTLRPTVSGALPSTTGLSFANTSGANLDLQNNGLAHTVSSLSGGGSTGGNISFGAATTTTLTVNQSTNTTYSGLISGASLTTGGIVKTGTGILTFGHAAHTFAGTSTITQGELRLNPSSTTATFASQIVLNGGKLSSTGIAATTVWTNSSTLNLNANSTIDLGSNAHDLKFANSSGVAWAGSTLTINGWTGTGGASGTAGRIFFGNTVGTLTPTQLGKITFTGYPGTPILLASGELVPAVAGVTYTWDGSTDGSWTDPTNWTPGTSIAGPTSSDNVIIPDNTLYSSPLAVTGSVSCFDFTVNAAPTGNGTYSIGAGASLTVGGAYVYGSSVAPTFHCTSTLTLNGSGNITVPAHAYGNLDLTGGNRTLANSGTIGICGTFTRGAGTYTVTGSTVDFNGTGAQTIAAGTYNNLTISNPRGSANLTSPAGTIAVAGTFDVSTLSAYTPVVNAASIFDFTSASAQSIPAFFYGQLNNTGNGNRTWAGSGTIDINQGFTPGSGTHTITGSTIQYSNTAATTWNLTTFTTNVAGRQYNNLIFNGGASTNWSLNGVTIGVDGNLSITSGTVIVGSPGGAATLTIDGNWSINGANATLNLTSSATNAGTINLFGNFNQSAGAFNKSGAGTGTVNFALASGTQTITQSGGTITNNGTTWNLGTGATAQTVQLATNWVVAAGTVSPRNGTTVDFQTFELSGTTTFTTQAGTTLMSANTNATGAFTASGLNGSVKSSGIRTYTAGTNFTFNGSGNQNTGDGVGVNSVATLTINTSSGATVTLTDPFGAPTGVQVTNTVNLVSGNLILAGDLQLNNAATFTGSPWGTTNMVVTNGTGRLAGNGRLIKIFPNGPQSNLSFTYPLGEINGTTEYSPVIINDLDYTAATSPYIAYKVVNTKHPNDPSLNNYLNRYWISVSSFTSGSGITMQADFKYTTADVVGTETLIKMNRYDQSGANLGTWTEDAGSSAGSNTLVSATLNGAASPADHDFDDDDIVGRLFAPLYFRSASAGPNTFELGASWLVSTDPAFLAPTGVTPTTYPTYSNSAGIRIMNGHSMTVTTAAGVDDMTIESGGTLTLASSMVLPFSVNNGTGTDLTVDGTVVNQSTLAWLVGGTISFSNGALYNHNTALGTVPASTWVAGSECRITGAVNSAPAGLGQSFSDFTWDCPGQLSSFNLSGALTTVGRDLKITNTGGSSNYLGFTATTTLAMTVGRDLIINGGYAAFATGTLPASSSLSITRDLLASSGSFNMSRLNSNATSGITATIGRNLDISGTGQFILAGNGSSGAGALTVTVAGTTTNTSSGIGLWITGSTKSATLTCNGLFTHSGTSIHMNSITSGTATLNANAGFTMTSGIFIVAGGASGVGVLNLADNQTFTLSGGTLTGSSSTATATINIGTNTTSATTTALNISGGTLEIATSGTGIVNVYGNMNLNSGSVTQTGGTATVNFRAQGINIGLPHLQTITQTSATVSGTIAFNIGVTGSYTNLALGSNINLGTGSTITVTGFTSTNASYLDFSTFTLSGLNFSQSNYGVMVTANPDGFWTIATGPSTGSLRTTNTRSLHATLGQFSYNGTSTQVTGDAVTNAYNFSVFNSTSGVTLSNNLSLTSGGTLFLNYFGLHGKLFLSNFNLSLASTASISGASATDYIVTNGTGKLIQTVGAASKDFPVGLSTYNPIRLFNSGTSDTYGVIVVDGVTSPAPNDGTKLINRYWNITEGTAGGSSLTTAMFMQYNGGEENANFAAGTNLKIGYFNGVAWADYSATQSGAGPYTVSPNASFSPAVASYTLGIGKDDGFLNPSISYVWNGSQAGGSWANTLNWTPNGNPNGVDDITIPDVGSYTHELVITGTRSVNNLTVSANGRFTMGASSILSVGGTYTYSSSTAAIFDCSSTLNLAGTGSITIPAADYGNLNLTGGDRVLPNGGTVGICGTFTPGAGTYTITGSTVNFNGTGAQTVNAFNYENLTVNVARSGATLTSPSGTIQVAGTFTVSGVPNYTPSVNAASIFNFSSASAQSIPAFFYGQLNNSGNGNRTWASSGIIDIGQGFSPGSGTHTITGSTVRYSHTAATSWTLTNFTTNVAGRQYNNLEFAGGASTTWEPGAGFNPGVAGTLTVSGGTLRIANTTTSNTLTVDGNTTITSGTIQVVGSSATAGITGNFITNDLTISGTGKLNLDAATTTQTGIVTVNQDLNVTSTIANAIDLGSGGATANNVVNIKRNFSKSGIGTLGLSGTYNSTAIYNFNGTGTQTWSHAGAAMTGGGITVANGSTLQLLTNMVGASSANANPINIAGELDAQGFSVTPGNAANTFSLNATGTIRTSSASGIAGVVSGFTPAPSFASGGTFIFTGTSVNTGFSGFSGITSSNQYTITWLGTTSLTLDKTMDLNAFNFTNNGLVFLGNFDLYLPSSAGALTGTGFGVTKMFVTNGTGTLGRAILSSGTGLPFTWPIGENSGTTEYSPVSITSISGSAINGSVRFRVVDGVHGDLALATSYLSRYWPMTVIGFTNPGYSLGGLTFTYNGTSGDIVVGPEASLKGNSYNSATTDWTQFASSSAGSGVLTITSGPNGSNMPSGTLVSPLTYDITGRIDVPVYYRTVSGGSWSTPGIWEISSDPAFSSPPPVTPVNPPTTANSDSVLIRNTHTVNVNSAVAADEVAVKSGGVLNITTGGTYSLPNGSGAIDMRVDGQLLVATPLTISSGSVLFVPGLVRQTVASQITATGTLRFGATGSYEHQHNAGSIPASTWDAGSTCILKNMTANAPGGLTQTFSNFTVDCPTLLATGLNTGGNLQTVTGNLTLISTNSNPFRLSSGSGYTLNIGGNLDLQANSQLDFSSGGGTSTVSVTGNVTMAASTLLWKTSTATITFNITGNFIQSGGTFDVNNGSSGGGMTVNFNGDVTMNGVVQRSNGGTYEFRFTKASGLQTLIQGTPITTAQAILWTVGTGSTTNTLRLGSNVNVGTSGTTVWTVKSGSTIDFQEFTLSGANAPFTMENNTGLITGNSAGIASSGASGSVLTGGTRTFTGASNNNRFTYNRSTGIQSTGSGLPTTMASLTIDNTSLSGSNTVSCTNNNHVVTTLNLTNGLLAIGSGNTMIIASGGTVNATSGNFATGSTGGMLRFSTPAGGSFTGTCNPFSVETNGNPCGINFGTGTVTIQSGGVFNINAGGFVNTNAPAYASGSSLWYLTGGTYGRGLEWSTNTGKGYPHHVVVAGSTTLSPARSDNSYANVPFQCAGNLTINSGANIYMDEGGHNMTEDLRVLGNFNLQGNFSLSQTSGSDLFIGGNWTNNGSGTNAFMTGVNGRQVEFNGGSPQTIGGSNGTVPPFEYVSINNSASNITTNLSLTINQRLQMNSGKLIIGNNNITLGSSGFIDQGGVNSYIVTNGTGYVSQTVNGGDDWFPIGPSTSAFGPVTLNQSGTGETINVRVINIAGLALPSYQNAVNDTTQMVKLEWVMNESVAGANSLRTTFGWQGAGTAGANNIEGSGFDRTSAVYHGNYNSGLSKYVVRATNATTGSNPYFSISTVAQPFTGTMAANQRFVVGNINGILPCLQTSNPGDWNTATNWVDLVVPPQGSAVCINHAMTLAAAPPNPQFITVNGPNGNITISPGVTLTLEPSGTFTNNKAGFSMTSGTVAFQGGTSTINGSQAAEFNNLQLGGNTTLTTTPTINNSLEILPGGFILSATGPNYGPSSTLIYNTGGGYNRSNEWNATSGPGFPTNVLVTGNTSLDISNGSNTARAISGNFQIDNGSSATMSAMTGNLTVPGNFTLNGDYTQSTNVGGDLVLGGNWTSGASASLTSNNRDVRFNSGISGQNITVNNSLSFGFLTIDNGSTGVTLSTDIRANTFRVNSSRTFNHGANKIIINPGGNVLIDGTFNANSGTIEYTDGGNFTNNGTFNRGTSTIDFLGTNPGTVVGTVQTNFHNIRLAPSSGIDFGGGALRGKVSGTFQLRAGSYVTGNAPIYEPGSTLMYSGGGTFNRNVEWDPSTVQNVEVTNSTTLKCGTNGTGFNHQMAANLTIQAGSTYDMSGPDMTVSTKVGGSINLLGTLTLSGAAGGDLEVSGDFANNGGTFTCNSRLTTFNGSTNAVISGSTNTNFCLLTVNKTSGNTLTASVPFTASLAGGTQVRVQGGTFDLNGQAITLGGGTNTLRVDAGYANSQTLKTGGTNIGSFNTYTDDGVTTATLGGRVDYSSAGSETLISGVTTYNQLWLTGGSTKTITQTTTANGDINIDPLTTLDFGATASILNSKADIVNQGTTTGTGLGKIEINGTVVQNMSGSGTYRNLDINKASNDVNSTGTPTISSKLNVLSGKVLQASLSDSIILASGATLTETIISPVSQHFVRGKVHTTRVVGVSAETFGGLGVALTAGSNLGTVEVTRLSGVALISPITSNSGILRSWKVTPSVQPALPNRDISFTWPSQDDNSLDMTTAMLYKRSAGNLPWLPVTSPTNVSASNPRTITYASIPSFSEFTVSDLNNPLPLDLLTFNGRNDNGNGLLTWVTANEKDIQGFEILKSTDGIQFYKIGFTPSLGTSGEYRFVDKNLTTGSYYKLVHMDKNGAIGESRVIFIHAHQDAISDISLYPNPGTSGFTIRIDGLASGNAPMQISLVAMDGKEIIREEGNLTDINNQTKMGLENLPNGVYLLKIKWNESTRHIKWVKQ